MKSLQEIENDFVSNLRNKYINPARLNPKGSTIYFREFLTATGIDKLSPNKITDISTALENVSHYLVAKKSPIYAEQSISDQYVESYNAAFLIKLLNKDLNNISIDKKIIQSYDDLKNNQGVTFGNLISKIEENLGRTDTTIITYAELGNNLKDILIEDYFANTSRVDPAANKSLFKIVIARLGIEKIKDVKIKDKITAIPGAIGILDGNVKKQDVFSVNNTDLSFLYFLVLYKFISIAVLIQRGKGLFRLPSELTKWQLSQIKGNIAESDLTVQNVLDIWDHGYDMYIDNKKFKLSDISKMIALGVIIGGTYYILRQETK